MNILMQTQMATHGIAVCFGGVFVLVLRRIKIWPDFNHFEKFASVRDCGLTRDCLVLLQSSHIVMRKRSVLFCNTIPL